MTNDGIEGVVFDVQRFSVHDGPGIRTTIFLKGCPLRCRWCQNPEGLVREPELSHWAERCAKCGECAKVCPQGAIHLDGEHVDRSCCDLCGLCVPVCPNAALQLVGRTVSLEALVQEALRDRSFFEASGGGVTVSGGEPTWQLRFLSALVRRLHDQGVSVGLETCGAFSWSDFEPILPMLDFVFLDLKLMDPLRHREATGGENRVILENARRLVEKGARVTFRMPVVPGFNDDDANLRATARLLRELGAGGIVLLRYHAMGEAKLARLGSSLAPLVPVGSERAAQCLARAVEVLSAEGIEAST